MLLGSLAVLLLWSAASSASAQQPPTATVGSAAAADAWPSPFGIGSCHVRNRSAEDNATWIPQMAAIGLHEFRTPHANWDALEPEKGRWAWEAFDRQRDYLTAQNFRYGILLIGNAKWNTLDPPGSLPVNNIAGWSNYVTEVAKHVKGKANCFEVWNEPPNFTGKDQTPADYSRIVVAAHDAAKAVDPHCFIGLAAKSAHVNYLEQVIRAGAKDKFDYIVLHPYEVLDGVAHDAGSEAIYMHIVPTVRRMLASHNPAKQNVPIIFTELGCDAAKGLGLQAQALVKAYVMGIAQGVACVHWFEGRDGDSGPMGLLDRAGKPRPAYTALAETIRHLGQRPEYLGWTLLNDRHYGFVFQGADGVVLVTWARPGKPDLLAFTREMKIVNPLTGIIVDARSYELTSSPAFVLGPPEMLVAAAKNNRTKPLSWGGDFTNAKEVSIEFGETTIERGLHTRAGNQLADAVVAYGGSARAGNVPGGSVFSVDPTFLCYDKTPLEITAIVRRNEANDNAGFKLVYESPTGFKTAGTWYTVPDNKQWHTVTWRIDDPQFVNYWGYNFILESDGDTYNKYYIQSVTVKKLAK